MIRDIQERLTMMVEKGDYELTANSVFQILPIGLTMGQIKQYRLPPNPTKMTDTRSNGYVKKYGKTCWEVDALDPRTLTEIVESHIVQQIDVDLYEEILEKEARDIKILEKFIGGGHG